MTTLVRRTELSCSGQFSISRLAPITLAGCLLVLATACNDAVPTEAVAPPKLPYFDKGGVPHMVDCTATVATKEITCVDRDVPPSRTSSVGKSPRSPSYTLLGAGRVRLRSSNVVTDNIAHTLSADVTVQDSLASPIGTPDGTTVVGSKVIFHTGPTVLSYYQPGDTGSVTLANADGVGNYTGQNQPYFSYPGIIAPYQISAARRWVFNVPSTVKNYTWSTYVFTASPAYLWVPEAAPTGTSQAAWDSLTATSNLLVNPPSYTGTVVQNALWVHFRRTAPANGRDSAVASVGGVVVGGYQVTSSDGYYLLRLPPSSFRVTAQAVRSGARAFNYSQTRT